MRVDIPDRDAAELAYEAGRRQAMIDSTLAEHTQHLAIVNNNIQRTMDSLAALENKLDGMIARQKTRDAVAIALASEVQKANEKQISTRAFAIGVLSILLTLLGLILTQAHLFA